jgi:hypothetical protein
MAARGNRLPGGSDWTERNRGYHTALGVLGRLTGR